jgi:hypothetical protein
MSNAVQVTTSALLRVIPKLVEDVARRPGECPSELQSQAFAPSARTKSSWSLMDLQALLKPQNPFVFTKIDTFGAASETKKL